MIKITIWKAKEYHLTLSRWRPLSYRNQSIDLQSKSMDWFLYDNGFGRERINCSLATEALLYIHDHSVGDALRANYIGK